ncbi:CopY/TcrY family copper transport repressor [Allofustis seminis]|uniref:CopY/TcrY family copper transport repressor n=1 Tax=Allofustis seminis TaxID=166939 RepID=UPI00035EB819|nr:CopY/TcrY family copper transport repressor [Allofustis seminis]
MSHHSISPAEWEVMRVVWAHDHVKSREVIEILGDKMNWKPATIKTLLRRLVDKQVLSIAKEKRSFIYTPIISEEEMAQEAADTLFSMICAKEAGALIQYLIETHPLSKSDVKVIQDIVAKKMEMAPTEVDCHCIPGQCRCNLIHH